MAFTFRAPYQLYLPPPALSRTWALHLFFARGCGPFMMQHLVCGALPAGGMPDIKLLSSTNGFEW